MPALDLAHLPAVDHHCHPWLAPGPPFDAPTYRMLFTEGAHPDLGLDVPATVYYRWTLRELGRVLGCPPQEDAVLAARAALGHAAVAARLMAEANIGAAVIDHLFHGRGTDLSSVAEMGPRLGGARTFAALRLESVLEALVVSCDDIEDFEARFRARLDRPGLAAEGVVSLKSIAAYRGGLEIGEPGRASAAAAFPSLKAAARRDGRVRVADPAFLHFFLRVALAWCAQERFPIQFHTGFGDPDVDLRTGGPLALRGILGDERYRAAPIVLLHAGYPAVREASYLAGVFPNAHLDLGLAIPFAAADLDGIVRGALALAPSTRVLWSSDAFAIPEHAWFAAVQGRRALGRVLGELADRGALDRAEAEAMAAQILGGNAARLYGL